MTPEPLIDRWCRDVIRDADGTTTVCCMGNDGRPVALVLTPELADALGGVLVDPATEEDTE
ncbi:hypothetical protein [Nocardiopsis lucentensis]|uniref:hypothetical protein n=1 Tax=Nocardiopsis lucentensis TaxID=53441 RepID=UPI000345A542|nr:hypothetical protein [Nocardiopsis lucentensis]